MKRHTSQNLATMAIHAGESHADHGAHVAPIYQTSTFAFEDMNAVEAYAAGDAAAYIYSRGGNPSRAALAAKLAALEGHQRLEQADAAGDGDAPVVAAEIFSSGMAAISAALLGIAQAGDHVIAQEVLYGSTDHLVGELLPRYGITTSRVRDMEPETLAQALADHPQTRAIFIETPANPTISLVDIAAVVEVAQAHRARVIVDNTFATPVLQRPLDLGADVVVHSNTKYISGHGVILGGAAVSYDVELMEEKIASLIKYLGAVPSPFDCWLTNLGLKTLPLRMAQHCANAMQVARFLEDHPAVATVHYPGLESHPQHQLARRQMDDFGAMIAFELKGGYDACCRFLDRLRICVLAVSLGNLDTLIEHPASMTHSSMAPEQRARIGISDGLIRLSVGLEAADDIVADFAQALARRE
jgi:methionine-gamma-lyase